MSTKSIVEKSGRADSESCINDDVLFKAIIDHM